MYKSSSIRDGVFEDTTHKTKQVMCVIIVKQNKRKSPMDIIENASVINPHGLGIVWLDSFEVTYHKSNEYDVLDTERPFIAHFRYATVGAVNKSNTHPFVCGSQSDELLMMNGTIKGLGNAKDTDSKVLARSLGDIKRHLWKGKLSQYTNVRFLSVNIKTRMYQIYNRHLWTKRDGIWYSKSNIFQDNYIAVYGTLKKGNSNYYNYLTKSTFVGQGETVNRYPLLVQGLPYLVNKKGIGHNVVVHVFKVSDDVLRQVDGLEGHPRWYRREKTNILMDSGKVLSCWTYFNDRTIAPADVFHKSYEPSSYKSKGYFKTGVAPTLFDSNPKSEEPFCTGCYSNLMSDGYDMWYCDRCGEWYTSEDVNNLIY